jgi:hypothetical protein
MQLKLVVVSTESEQVLGRRVTCSRVKSEQLNH